MNDRDFLKLCLKNVVPVTVLSSSDVVKPQVDRTHALIVIKAGGLSQLWKCISVFIQEGFASMYDSIKSLDA